MRTEIEKTLKFNMALKLKFGTYFEQKRSTCTIVKRFLDYQVFYFDLRKSVSGLFNYEMTTKVISHVRTTSFSNLVLNNNWFIFKEIDK